MAAYPDADHRAWENLRSHLLGVVKRIDSVGTEIEELLPALLAESLGKAATQIESVVKAMDGIRPPASTERNTP